MTAARWAHPSWPNGTCRQVHRPALVTPLGPTPPATGPRSWRARPLMDQPPLLLQHAIRSSSGFFTCTLYRESIQRPEPTICQRSDATGSRRTAASFTRAPAAAAFGWAVVAAARSPGPRPGSGTPLVPRRPPRWPSRVGRIPVQRVRFQRLP